MSVAFRKMTFAVTMVCLVLPSSAYSLACGALMSVANEPDMNDAIACYNIGNIDSTISVSNNFTATTSLEAITPSASTQLNIVGNGNKITFAGSAGNLFAINNGALVVEDIELENTADSAIFAEGNAAVTVNDMIFDNNGHALHVTVHP